MGTVNWTARAEREYRSLQTAAAQTREARKRRGVRKSSKQEGLFNRVRNTVQFLAADPRHPSLQTHEYDSLPHPFDSTQKVFVAYAQQHAPSAYRVFWCYGPGRKAITIIAITPHP